MSYLVYVIFVHDVRVMNTIKTINANRYIHKYIHIACNAVACLSCAATEYVTYVYI